MGIAATKASGRKDIGIGRRAWRSAGAPGKRGLAEWNRRAKFQRGIFIWNSGNQERKRSGRSGSGETANEEVCVDPWLGRLKRSAGITRSGSAFRDPPPFLIF
jgi:hypothetical protein